MRKKICDTISIIAILTFDADEEWPELFPRMFQAVSSSNSSWIQKENALILFTNLCMYVKNKYNKELSKIAQLLCVLASDNEKNLDVRLAAIRATWSLVECCNQDDESDMTRPFAPLVGLTLSVITDAISSGHRKAFEAIEDLIDLADSPHVRLFSKNDLERTLKIMFEIASAKSSSRLRLLGIELIMALMETRPAAIRKIKPPENAAVVAMLPILTGMLMELPDLQENELRKWGSRYPQNACAASASQHLDDEDDHDDTIDFDAFGASLEYIDRLTRAIKPKYVLPVIFSAATELFSVQNNWKYPHAALLMVAHTVEFITKKEPMLGDLVRTACSYSAENPHMRVRHAGFTLLARLSYDCAPEIHKRHSQSIVPAILRGFNDPVPRIQCHAANALINYASSCYENDLYETALKPYLGEVVSKIFDCLSKSNPLVQEYLLSALGSVAKCANDEFIPYYAHTIPVLKSALENISPELYGLKARLIDCVSIIGLSVGREVFVPDAIWLVPLLANTPLLSTDPNIQHLQVAWLRLSQVLGEELSPFLEKIVPFVLESASKSLFEDDEDEDEDDDETEVDRAQAAAEHLVRTAAVDDRLLALEILCTFASHTKRAYLPYLHRSFAVFFRDVQMEHCNHDDIRAKAAEGLADLVSCALSCLEIHELDFTSFSKLLVETLQILCVSSNSEDSLDTLKIIVRSVLLILQSVAPLVQVLKHDVCPDYVEPCASVLIQLLKDSIQRRALDLAELTCDKVEGEADEELEMEYEEKVLEEHELHFLLSATIGALIKANPNTFVPSSFTAIGPYIFDLCHPVRLCHDQKTGVCILDDIIEEASLNSIPTELNNSIFQQLLVSLKVEQSTSPREGLREVGALVQAASYGLGIGGMRYGENFTFAAPAVTALMKLIQSTPKDLRFTDQVFATCLDNCVSAMMKIYRNCPQQLNRNGISSNEILKTWLEYFPLQHDVLEAQLNSTFLIEMIEQNQMPESFFPLAVKGLASVLATEYLADNCDDRVLNLLGMLKEKIGQDAFLKSVNPEQLSRLAAISKN